ncbi:FAM72 protein-domain-containing protein [Melanogaster broomeanus]|nr:FAM72 protein-domain-containing protein [Melanogaster broomeanus]
MFSYFPVPSQVSGTWQTHIPFVQYNPYPPPPPPPQLVHKVWILDCRSCGTFLTNRGMKAVLLLRPNVSLFSTDALPINCSAYSTNPDALRPPPCRLLTSALPARTCECLTQTLCCHTCGTAVGYMIVIPCARCTSSITATNRATNGHRFVFHSSEVIAYERHHIPDEPGVIPIDYPTPPPSSPPPLAPAYSSLPRSAPDVPVGHRRLGGSVPSQIPPPPPSTTSPSLGPEYLASPQMESADFAPSSVSSSPDPFAFITSTSPRLSPRPFLRSPSPRIPAPQPHVSQSGTRSCTPEPLPRKLKAGDVLYWHHLTKNGEIPGIEADPRAKVPDWRRGLQFLDR